MLVSETFEKEGVCRNQLGHEFTPEYFEIWLRTEIARDKLMFYKQVENRVAKKIGLEVRGRGRPLEK
jgi:glutamine synthetase